MVRIRLSRTGARNRPSYRVVVADSRSPRDGMAIDTLGFYNPLPDPPEVVIDEEKALKWLRRGAQPSEPVARLLAKTGILQKVGGQE
ncbi:MAG: 30S ribosomal protein S16 [Dehalococcoidia bacterium]